ncbi:MAG: methyltransferase domain-containing protein [Lachnospiraceae bacterium]|nr:methyltransferase domain-containing protein [Lachnospiraceae bacterium]
MNLPFNAAALELSLRFFLKYGILILYVFFERRVILQENFDDFEMETTSIWSFPDRGNWATHAGNYRGNWSPYIPKNLILRYTKENDWVLDPFLGSGTTAVEAALLQRNFIGVDINPNALELAQNNMKGIDTECHNVLKLGDACKLDFLKNNSIDLICMHPPYCNIIKYSRNLDGDLSLLEENDFYEKMKKVAEESHRILKQGKYLGLLIADMRKNGYIIPLGFNVMQIFQNQGFLLKEIVIKEQHNCRSTAKWNNISQNRNFLLIKHEYLLIFRK